MKRILQPALVLILVAAATGIWWVTQRLDGAVAAVIEDTASQLLGTSVSVGGVNVDLAAGSVTIEGLRVANPEGENLAFSDEPAFTLGEVTVAIDLERLDPADFSAAPIPLTLVRVAQPKVNAEVSATGTNLDVLRRNVGSAGSPSDSSDLRLEIDRFEFSDGALRADTRAVGGEVREVELPTLRLRNLRGTPDEVGRRVLDAFLRAAVRQLARDQISNEVEERLDEVKEKAASALRSLLGVEQKE